MPGRVHGKLALVTGAASGIGRATAELLAREGARVIAADVNLAGAQATADAVRTNDGECRVLPLDVRSEADWEAALAPSDWGAPNILIANAGVSFAKPVTETALEEWRAVMDVNLDGVFLGVKHAVRRMRETGGGSIVASSSLSGVKPAAGAAAYCASKAGLLMLVKTAALECARNGDNIRINAVLPGGVKTPMWRSMDFFQDLVAEHGSEEAAYREMSGEEKPLRRFAEPEEIARTILFLASDEASYISGAELVAHAGGD